MYLKISKKICGVCGCWYVSFLPHGLASSFFLTGLTRDFWDSMHSQKECMSPSCSLFLYLILCEVPLCDIHHIGGDFPLDPWKSLAWGSLTSPLLDDYACCLGGLLTCVCLVDHPLVALFDGCGAYYLIMVWFWYICLSWMCNILFMDDRFSPPRG